MSKKRKSGRSSVAQEIPVTDLEDSRKRIRTFEDVADSDDEFHLNRDRILLEEEPQAKRRRKTREEEAFLEISDEEVLDQSDAGLEEEDDSSIDLLANEPSAHESEEEEEEEEVGWGTSKADAYGADAIETEEQALEEEAEARRLQKKQLQSMSTVDYGFDDDDWNDSNKTEVVKVITETLPELEIPPGASPTMRLDMLKARYPEFLPLSRELLELNITVGVLAGRLADEGNVLVAMPKTKIKHDAASAYLGALAMYFALLTSGSGAANNKALSASQIRNHDIMTMLINCRSLWMKAKILPDDEQQHHRPTRDTIPDDSKLHRVNASESLAVENNDKSPKSRKARHEEAVKAAKQARIAENLKRTEAGNAELDRLLTSSDKVLKRGQHESNDSEIGEEGALTAAQAEEKARQRKSLRFYTSQIAQKANKRGAAGRTAGGDDDIPHRERLRDRQARLNAEAEKRGKRGADAGDDLGGHSDEGDAEEAREIRQAVDDDDDYYDMIAARTAQKKSDKIAYGEAQKRAGEQGGVVIEQQIVGPDGKRKITYAIEKNKGLTPHRKKDVRNPRVKKRKKFEEKSKKLASMKATYKGGEGRGGYGGELTGIKANLVKSVKL